MIPGEILDREWAAALAHSGLDPVSVCVFWAPGSPYEVGFPPAVHFLPGREITEIEGLVEGEMITRINGDDVRAQYRIVITALGAADTPLMRATLAGLCRHELEHARHFRGPQADQIFELDAVADELAAWLDGPDGVVWYRRKPTEVAANAAAAAHVHAVHVQMREALRRTRFAPFTDATQMTDPEEIPRLTVEYIQEAVTALTSSEHWMQRIDDALPGASQYWSES